MTKRSVLVVGCGIAGPALAYWLLEHGFEPTLVERAPSPRREGYAIDFWGLGYDLVERMGVLPQVLDAGYAMRELRLVDARGRRVGGFDVDVFRKATNGRFTTLPRGALSEVLLQAIEGRAEVRWATTPIAFEQRADGVLVQFDDGRSQVYRCVVGADGAHSTVREKIFGELPEYERYLGFRVVAFEAAGYPKRDEHAYVSHAAPGRQLARLSLRNNRTLVLLIAREEEPGPKHWERRDVLDYMHARYHDLGWEAQDMLSAAEGVEAIYIDRVSQIRLRRWWRGHAALLGDAAFAPSLLAGQGCALAIIGAYVLAGELAHGSIEDAFVRYERRLRSFMLGKQGAARRFAHSFAPRTRLGIFVRNQITKAFRVPAVARMALGRSLRDRITLPYYPELSAPAVPAAASIHEVPR